MRLPEAHDLGTIAFQVSQGRSRVLGHGEVASGIQGCSHLQADFHTAECRSQDLLPQKGIKGRMIFPTLLLERDDHQSFLTPRVPFLSCRNQINSNVNMCILNFESVLARLQDDQTLDLRALDFGAFSLGPNKIDEMHDGQLGSSKAIARLSQVRDI